MPAGFEVLIFARGQPLIRQTTVLNDVKIYNFTGGKTIPEWLPERKRRLLLKKDVDLQVSKVSFSFDPRHRNELS